MDAMGRVGEMPAKILGIIGFLWAHMHNKSSDM